MMRLRCFAAKAVASWACAAACRPAAGLVVGWMVTRRAAAAPLSHETRGCARAASCGIGALAFRGPVPLDPIA